MHIWHVFLVRPFVALAILICPLAILSCWSVLHKRAHQSFDRFLIGFVGLLSIFQSVRLLRDCGLLTLPSNQQFNDAIELLVALFYFLATSTLMLARNDRVGAGVALRLAKAAPPHVRYPMKGMLRILWEDTQGRERISNAILVNASANGLKLQLDEEIPVRSHVACNDATLGIAGRASVRYCIFREGKYEIGLEFEASGSVFEILGRDQAVSQPAAAKFS